MPPHRDSIDLSLDRVIYTISYTRSLRRPPPNFYMTGCIGTTTSWAWILRLKAPDKKSPILLEDKKAAWSQPWMASLAGGRKEGRSGHQQRGLKSNKKKNTRPRRR
ncbi:unnamed protein product, partial [Pylaiella littoralis]